MSHSNNDQIATKKSKLSRNKKQGKNNAGHPTVKPLFAVADLNETCDFKEPMILKKTSDGVNSVRELCKDDQSSNPVEATETVLCQVCNKDISHMNSVRRSQHVNRCIDKIEEKEIENKKQTKKTTQANNSPIPDCPVCSRSFKSANSRQVHLKRCAAIFNVPTEEMLKRMRNQEQDAENKQDDSGNQLSKLSKSSKPVQSRKRKIKEPKSQFDEEVQLALAVSSSLAEQNMSEADMLKDNLVGMTGQNKRRKKKQFMEDVCLLTTLSNEDRQRRVEQRLNSVLVDEVGDSDGEEDIPPLQGSSLRRSDTQTKLWRIGNHDNSADVLAFYVSALMPPIVANRLKTGSKLKRLSSIPGRDKTFMEPSANKPVLSPGAGEDVFTASTQTAVVLAELAVDDTGASNVTMLDQSATGDIIASPNASGFCEETLSFKEETLTQSRLEAVSSFSSLINCAEYSDLSIQTSDNDTVHGHSAFIFTRFPSLKQLFHASNSSIHLPLSKEACLVFMEYIYAGALSCTASIQHELAEMAEKLDILKLKEACSDLIFTGKSDTENVDDENKSNDAFAQLHPVMNMKDIWGESDSEAEDRQDVRREGTDTECETDKQEPICDEDYNEIRCTQRKLISHDTKHPIVINDVDINDHVCKDSTLPCTQSKFISQNSKSPTEVDEVDNNISVCKEDSTIKCTQREHISDEEENYSTIDKIHTQEPMYEQDHDLKSTKTLISSHEEKSATVIERINKKENVDHEDCNDRFTERSYVSNKDRITALIDMSDGEKSMSGESDIMLLGNLCDNISNSDKIRDDSSTNGSLTKETCNLGDKIPVCSDRSNTDYKNSEDDCDLYIGDSTPTLKTSQPLQGVGEMSTLQTMGDKPTFSPVNIVNSDVKDQEKNDTSMVDLFESPLFNGSYIQPKSTEGSPTSSNSPLFNRKRKTSSQGSSSSIQLDLKTIDKSGTKLNSSDKLPECRLQVIEVQKELNAGNCSSFTVETKHILRKDNVIHYSEDNREKVKIFTESFTETEDEKSKKSKFLGLELSLSKSDCLPHIHSDLQEGNYSSSEINVHSQNVLNSKGNNTHVTPISPDKRNKQSLFKENVNEGYKGDELCEEIDLISVDSEDENQLHSQADITEEDVDEDEDCRDVGRISQQENVVPGLEASQSVQNIKDLEDVWEDFEDYDMGYNDLPSPVISQESPEHENLEKTNCDVTLTEQTNNGDILNKKVDNATVDLDDKDDSFVFHVSENNPSEKSQSNSFKTPTVSNKSKEKKVWVPPSPFTPMPDYDSMNTPLLKKEVKKYGVRPVSKKRMVTVLKDIYHQTHQYETDSEFEDDAEEDGKNSIPDAAQSPSKHSDVLSQDSVTSSQESDTNDNNEVMEESIMLEGSTSESDTQSSPQKGVDVKKKMHNYILSNQDLHRRVLMFEPLEIDVLKANMKEAGIKCSMDKLLEFLDEKCIAFTSKNTRKRAQTKRGRKKTSPKKQNKVHSVQNDFNS